MLLKRPYWSFFFILFIDKIFNYDIIKINNGGSMENTEYENLKIERADLSNILSELDFNEPMAGAIIARLKQIDELLDGYRNS